MINDGKPVRSSVLVAMFWGGDLIPPRVRSPEAADPSPGLRPPSPQGSHEEREPKKLDRLSPRPLFGGTGGEGGCHNHENKVLVSSQIEF